MTLKNERLESGEGKTHSIWACVIPMFPESTFRPQFCKRSMSTTFVVRRKGSFASLIQSTSLGPYGLEARPPVTVRDLYVDTDDGELLQRGMRLLVRDVDDELTAHLIGVEDSESSWKWVGSLLQASLDPDRRVLTSAFELPRGDLQDALLEYVEGERLLQIGRAHV